jgi:carbon monoxide dehydrogenase subunit G
VRIEERFAVAAPVERVWRLLIDVPELSTCMPGVEEVQAAGEDMYQGRLRVKLGPISASFAGHVGIVEAAPLQRLVARAEGKDRVTGTIVQADLTASLEGAAADRTEVAMTLDVVLRGRLAQVGSGVFLDTARRFSQEFVSRLRVRLEHPSKGEG